MPVSVELMVPVSILLAAMNAGVIKAMQFLRMYAWVSISKCSCRVNES